MDEDSDSETEEESSDSDTGKKAKSKSLLDGILTAPRSWSNGDRWEEEPIHRNLKTIWICIL